MRRLVAACLLAATAVLPSGSNPSRAADQHSVDASDERVQTTAGPEVERTTDTWAIIRWTSSKLRGTSLHYGMVHYGTDPHALSETAKSPNRRNPALPSMIFRVQVDHLQPGTTYYYRVESVDALDKSEGSGSPVNQFTTEQSP